MGDVTLIYDQVLVFLKSIGVGAILAWLFDLFRLMRGKHKQHSWLIYLQDSIYLFLATMLIIITAFIFNNGEIRGYMIIRLFHWSNAIFITAKSCLFKELSLFHRENIEWNTQVSFMV